MAGNRVSEPFAGHVFSDYLDKHLPGRCPLIWRVVTGYIVCLLLRWCSAIFARSARTDESPVRNHPRMGSLLWESETPQPRPSRVAERFSPGLDERKQPFGSHDGIVYLAAHQQTGSGQLVELLLINDPRSPIGAAEQIQLQVGVPPP